MRPSLKHITAICLAATIAACKDATQEERIESAVKAHVEARKEAEATAAERFRKLQQAKFLLGAWKGPVGKGISIESWYKQDDSTFAGSGLFIKAGKTMSEETIELTQKGDDVYYIPTVKGQNGDKPVTFKMTAVTDNTLIFENPQHDFPQIIKYTLYGTDSLVAEISDKAGTHKEVFAMKKTQVSTPKE